MRAAPSKLEGELERTSKNVKKTPDIFIANEITTTKKVRSFLQSETKPWQPPLSHDQQYSVLSNQHPSMPQTGVNITKMPSDQQKQNKSKKSKDFKFLAKLQPVSSKDFQAAVVSIIAFFCAIEIPFLVWSNAATPTL